MTRSRRVACAKSKQVSLAKSVVDNRGRLVGGKLPSVVLAQPDRQIAVVDVHDTPVGDPDLCSHPPGHKCRAVNDQDAIGRMGISR